MLCARPTLKKKQECDKNSSISTPNTMKQLFLIFNSLQRLFQTAFLSEHNLHLFETTPPNVRSMSKMINGANHTNKRNTRVNA